MENCIFCKITNKEIPADVVYEDEMVLAFRDLEPQAPEHILIIPKKHIKSLMGFECDDCKLAAHIFIDVVPNIARKLRVDVKGFRLLTNVGDEGGQTVKHLHFHLLGGRSLTWPPG